MKVKNLRSSLEGSKLNEYKSRYRMKGVDLRKDDRHSTFSVMTLYTYSVLTVSLTLPLNR